MGEKCERFAPGRRLVLVLAIESRRSCRHPCSSSPLESCRGRFSDGVFEDEIWRCAKSWPADPNPKKSMPCEKFPVPRVGIGVAGSSLTSAGLWFPSFGTPKRSDSLAMAVEDVLNGLTRPLGLLVTVCSISCHSLAQHDLDREDWSFEEVAITGRPVSDSAGSAIVGFGET